MAKEESNKTPRVSTELEMDKQCKSSARFRSPDKDEETTTSLYLLNPSWEALGKPTKIKLSIVALED